MNIGLPFMTVVVFIQLDEAHDVKKAQEQLQKTVSDMQTTLQRIQAPNMRAMEKCVPSTSLATAFLSVGVCVCVCKHAHSIVQSSWPNVYFGKVCRVMCQRGGASSACAMGRLSLCLCCLCVCLSIDV